MAHSYGIKVALNNSVLGVVGFKVPCTHNLTDFTAGPLGSVPRQVFNQLLGNGRTALIGIVKMQKHIGKGGKGTLPVHTLMGVETLVLNGDKGVDKILGYALIAFVIFLCKLWVIGHPDTVKCAVQALVFGVVPAPVIKINGGGEVKLKVVKVLLHSAVNHCKGIKQKGGNNYTYGYKPHQKQG